MTSNATTEHLDKKEAKELMALSFLNKTLINSVGPAHYDPKIDIMR